MNNRKNIEIGYICRIYADSGVCYPPQLFVAENTLLHLHDTMLQRFELFCRVR